MLNLPIHYVVVGLIAEQSSSDPPNYSDRRAIVDLIVDQSIKLLTDRQPIRQIVNSLIAEITIQSVKYAIKIAIIKAIVAVVDRRSYSSRVLSHHIHHLRVIFPYLPKSLTSSSVSTKLQSFKCFILCVRSLSFRGRCDLCSRFYFEVAMSSCLQAPRTRCPDVSCGCGPASSCLTGIDIRSGLRPAGFFRVVIHCVV